LKPGNRSLLRHCRPEQRFAHRCTILELGGGRLVRAASSEKIRMLENRKFPSQFKVVLADSTAAPSRAKYFYCVFQKYVVHSGHPASIEEGRTRRHGR
jgi:hypothetical protein